MIIIIVENRELWFLYSPLFAYSYQYDQRNHDPYLDNEQAYKEYDDYVSIAEMQNTGKVVINLSTNDLKKEYDRICALGIASKQTEIRYINARNPYYYFSMKDPDDNTIEITGPYDETGGELK